MNPSEKAKELVEKFNGYVIENEGYSYAKQCALIAVEEATEETRDYCDDNYHQKRMSYWQQVKQEIQKL